MKKETVNENGLLITIVVLTIILSILGRLMSFGMITALFTCVPIIPLYFLLFFISGVSLAKVNKKSTRDYILFSALCITMIISSFTFIDANNNGISNMLFENTNNVIFQYISIIAFISNIVLAIYAIIITGKRKYIYEKK